MAMALFFGLRFFLLQALTVLLLREDFTLANHSTQSTPASTSPSQTSSYSNTSQGSTTSEATTKNSTSSPALTVLSQHTQSKTSPSETATTNNITFSPPLNSTRQHEHTSNEKVTDLKTTGTPPLSTTHQTIFFKTSSDGTGNTSTTTGVMSLDADTTHTVTSSTATPTVLSTSPAPSICNYTIERKGRQVIVNMQDYTEYTTLNDNLNNVTIQLQNKSFLINFANLKPCTSYNFTFNRCKTDESHNNTTNKGDDYCQQHAKLFKRCQEPFPLLIYIPPELPKINYTNTIPVKFTWINKPPQCPNLNYKCNGTGERDIEPSSLIPYHKYSCIGEFTEEDLTIKSQVININISCDVGNVTKLTASNISISVLWNITMTNCPCSNNFSTELRVNNTPWQKPTSDCNTGWYLSPLEPYTNYMLQFKLKAKEFEVLSFTKTQKTEPGIPKLKEELAVTLLSHNALSVSCEILKWNGEQGQIHTELYNGGKLERNETYNCSQKCSFAFDNLYYSTTYQIKVYAKNGNGKKSGTKELHKDTKYNDKAVLGFLGFLIVLTSLALLFVIYKIYLLKRKTLRDDCEMDLLPPNALLQVEPIIAEALVETYKKKRADESRLFMEEFQSIPRIFSNFSVKEAKKAENQTKNRYIDILPYDYNRVQLSNGGIHDYINASFIEGYKESNKYIAAQGPKEETVGDFWRMIWEQQSSVIVMVTRCDEGNKNKCAQYWPSLERETEIFDELVVKIKGQEKCPDYVIRHLSLMNKKEKVAERDVTQIQFISWPDHGVPADPGLLLKLRRRVNSFKNVFSGPIVIHCSAGVGRTGTYICIDAMIESLEAEARVDIYGYVARLRRQRCLMVQVEAQYVLIHAALIEYNQFGETEISLSDFHSVVNTLKQSETNECSLMEMEFQRLPKFRNYRTSNIAKTEENKKKNRYSSVIPYDFNRVAIKLDEDASHESDADDDYSSDEEDEAPTKYINASYLDGYWFPNSLIAAQGPLPDTVADFLHMLYQKRVKAVFMLSDCTENGKEFCSPYWANEKSTYEDLTVDVKETESFPTYTWRCLEIQHKENKETHKVEQYQFLKWAGCELPDNPKELIDMMRNARMSFASSSTKNLSFVVHCNDGSSRSGIFCALWKLLDSADTEKLVDVFQVVKDLRKARLGMITTFEQYQFLYTALEVAFPVQNGEVKRATSPETVQVINESTALISTDEAGHATKTDTKAGNATVSSEEEASTNHNVPETGPNESTTNGPTVSVEG